MRCSASTSSKSGKAAVKAFTLSRDNVLSKEAHLADVYERLLYGGCRVLKAAGIPHVGTHAIRHRSATDIANSGVPIKVGMALTAHKTVTQFMRYVHIEDHAVREAAELVAARRIICSTAGRSR